LEKFIEKLADLTDGYARACSSYARENQESPPDYLYFLLRLYRDLWDIVHNKTFDEFKDEYENKYLEQYGYNVFHYMDEFIDESLKTEKYKQISQVKQQMYVGDLPVELGNIVHYKISGWDKDSIEGSVTVTVDKSLLNGSVFHDNKVSIASIEELTELFNYHSPTLVDNVEFLKDDANIIPTYDTILSKDDVIVYKGHLGEYYQYALFGDNWDEDAYSEGLMISDLYAWTENPFYNQYSKEPMYEEIFVSKTFKSPKA
jgi:hypothetical protein